MLLGWQPNRTVKCDTLLASGITPHQTFRKAIFAITAGHPNPNESPLGCSLAQARSPLVDGLRQRGVCRFCTRLLLLGPGQMRVELPRRGPHVVPNEYLLSKRFLFPTAPLCNLLSRFISKNHLMSVPP